MRERLQSLRRHSGWRKPGAAELESLPARVRALVHQQEIESERLIGWVQLAIAAIFATLYVIAPRPADAPMALLAPVPIALALYVAFTLARLRLAYVARLRPTILVLSIIADMTLLLGLIWSFHLEYGQPAAFSLKVPTFIYVIVFVALRALRFDYRYVLAAGLAAAGGWSAVVFAAIAASPAGTVTRSFTAYLTGNAILIGAELDKIVAVLMATAVLAVAVRRARRMLVTATREQAASREISRFLSGGVAEAIANADSLVTAGEAVARDAAVLMLDIRGFTRFSMSVPPETVVQVLTGFHARIVPLVRAHGGDIHKSLGDGVMATFGTVTPSATAAADALRALEAILREVEHWQASLPRLGVTHVLEVNGAAAAGRVLFAALGNQDRLEYTVIGDAANLAAKLEKQNKLEGSRALVSAAMFELALAQGFVPGGSQPARRRVQVDATGGPVEVVVLL